MARKTKRQKTLPATLILRVINEDLKNAVCGSPTKCAIANAIRRTIKDPAPTAVRVKENRVAITWCGILHHFGVTDHALRLVAKNDNGTLSLSPTESHTIRLPLNRVRSAYINLPPARRQQIKDSNAARAAAGIRYRKNTRERAAEIAGARNKKLATVAAAAEKKAQTEATSRVAR
jgi:hypothetical protein